MVLGAGRKNTHKNKKMAKKQQLCASAALRRAARTCSAVSTAPFAASAPIVELVGAPPRAREGACARRKVGGGASAAGAGAGAAAAAAGALSSVVAAQETQARKRAHKKRRPLIGLG